MFKALIFDLDGTLHDYESASAEAMEKIYSLIHSTSRAGISSLRSVYLKVLADARNRGFHDGRSGAEYRRERFSMLLHEFAISDDGLLDYLLLVYEKELACRTVLYSDAIHTLDRLKDKYTLYLATAGPSDTQRKKLQLLGVAHYFEKVFISGELGKRKTTGDLFKHILDDLEFNADELLVIGDSYTLDIEGANKAGIKSVWINRLNEQPPANIHMAEIKNLGELSGIV